MTFRLAAIALLSTLVACGGSEKDTDSETTGTDPVTTTSTTTTGTTTTGTTTTGTTTTGTTTTGTTTTGTTTTGTTTTGTTTTGTTTTSTTTTSTTTTGTTTTTPPPNQAPVAVDDADAVDEGALIVIPLSSNDSDVDQGLDLGSLLIVTAPSAGLLTVNADGSVDYAHDGSETGVDRFTYTIDDLLGATSNVATVDVTVNPINDPPTAFDDVMVADRSLVTQFNLARNDTDPDDGLDLASIQITSPPSVGNLIMNVDGTVDYAHDGSAGSFDTFSYQISDLSGALSNVAIVDITVQDVVLRAGDLVEGDLVITEIMQNPAAVSDNDGEWFEFVNAAAFEIDLDGLEVSDASGVMFTVSGATRVAPGDYALFVRVGDPLLNGDLPRATYDYAGGANLLNGAGELILGVGPTVIDEVFWDGGFTFPDPSGASMQLSDGVLDVFDNDVGANWCEGTLAYGDGDLGTPGSANVVCVFNVGPTAFDDGPFDVDAGVSTQLDLAFNDTDPDDGVDLASIAITSPPTHGSVLVNADGTVDYTNDGLGDLSDAFAYTIADLSGVVSNEAGVLLNVAPVSTAMPVADLVPGDLVVTEFMPNPAAVSDTVGEWFEVYNATGVEVDLNGLEVSDLGSELFTVTGSLVVAADDYVLFVKNADPLLNGGLPAGDYAYGTGMTLANNSDEISLWNGATVIDTISYDVATVWAVASGFASQYPLTPDAALNDDGALWCEATNAYGDGDVGTPGAANSACAVNITPVAADDGPVQVDAGLAVNIDLAVNDSDADDGLDLASIVVVTDPTNGSVLVNLDGTVDYTHGGGVDTADSFTYTIDDTTGATSNEATVTVEVIQAPDVATIDDLIVGDLVITEATQNPDMVSDGDGEWFEIYNASGFEVDLEGLEISDQGSDLFTVTGSLVVAADAYVLFVKNDDPVANGGLPAGDYTYGSGMTLSNGADEIVVSAGLLVIDEILWDGGPQWPVPTGRSMQFPDAPDATLNDDGLLWCEGWRVFGDGDQGTPGAANDLCNEVPVALDDFPADADSSVVNVFDLALNDSDADDGLDLGSIIISTQAANGTTAVNADGTVDYTYDGLGGIADSFGYLIADSRGFYSNEAFVSFAVLITSNLAPTAVDDADGVDAGLTVTIDVAANDTDPDDGLDLGSVVVLSGPVNGTLLNNGDGTLDYTHDGGPATADSFTYTIDDNGAATSNQATVSISIIQAGGPLLVGNLLAGDLVVTEIIQNPDAATDTDGEWFEIYNASGSEVDLDGLEVSDLGSNAFTVMGQTLVSAGAYAVFAANADPLLNGGLPFVDYAFGSAMSLANGDDEVILSVGVLTIDEVLWDGGPLFPDPTGASMSLNASSTDATSNDNGLNWCEAATVYGSGDLGTPGAANPGCP
ncbi:MAG: tandem-95 repeat protein [Rhodobacterales bacterium]|nr:tandem-95 repeat protein [Rhodobacterales bacterium]